MAASPAAVAEAEASAGARFSDASASQSVERSGRHDDDGEGGVGNDVATVRSVIVPTGIA